jgi:signal peptidase I
LSLRRILFGSDPRRTAVRVLVLVAISVVVFKWVLLPVRAEGISMQPTYESGTLRIVNRLSFLSGHPVRGDIIAIRLAGLRVVYVKRVVALPGERLAIVDGQVMINGVPLDEPYVRNRRPWQFEEVTLGPNEYFVIGDNRGMNLRDHTLGRVDASRIIGRVIF